MQECEETLIHCPYCGEAITVLIDPEMTGQQYIEDCQVCCCPTVFVVSATEHGQLKIEVYREDDVF